jgi:DNA-binding NarL/FixJ family response regulator
MAIVGPDGAAHRAGLSRRESEVATLAGTGLTDREIAARLVLSVRTVESHLASVYRKLGISSRLDLAGMVERVA